MTLSEFEVYQREAETEALKAAATTGSRAPVLYKAGWVKRAAADGPITVVASHESEDRVGDIIMAAGWDLRAFRQNPVVLWSHDPLQPPIGRARRVEVEGKELVADLEFDQGDEEAQRVDGKFRRGVLNAVSVGFRPVEFARKGNGGFLFRQQELLELSAVAIPAHPMALAKMMRERSVRFLMVEDLKGSMPVYEEAGIKEPPEFRDTGDIGNGLNINPSNRKALGQTIVFLQGLLDKPLKESEPLDIDLLMAKLWELKQGGQING